MKTPLNSCIYIILWLLVLFSFPACTTIPISGRNQLMLINPRDIEAASAGLYAQMVATSKPCRNSHQVRLVHEVAANLIEATERYYRLQGQEHGSCRL